MNTTLNGDRIRLAPHNLTQAIAEAAKQIIIASENPNVRIKRLNVSVRRSWRKPLESEREEHGYHADYKIPTVNVHSTVTLQGSDFTCLDL